VKINIARGNLDVSNAPSGDILAGEVQSITVDRFAGIWVTTVRGLAWMTICTDSVTVDPLNGPVDIMRRQ
jgi:hypothetical protein